VDVMDGRFVPPITIGAQVVKALRKCTTLPLDVHLMIEAPELQIDEFARAGADIITVHAETCPHLHRTLQQIKQAGAQAGVAINPSTPLSAIDEVLASADVVMIMTVNPGFGGQTFIPEMLDKISRLRKTLDSRDSSAELEVDGGVKAGNIAEIAKAGARVLVAGAAVFGTDGTVAEAVATLRANLAQEG
jgi:ribulose-phosphate 3-epimerase